MPNTDRLLTLDFGNDDAVAPLLQAFFAGAAQREASFTASDLAKVMAELERWQDDAVIDAAIFDMILDGEIAIWWDEERNEIVMANRTVFFNDK